jgi:RHS repeat-associated protein
VELQLRSPKHQLSTVWLCDHLLDRRVRIDQYRREQCLGVSDAEPAPPVPQGDEPSAVRVAADGTLYIADSQNERVRAVGVDGIIRTVAGGGYHWGPDGSPATEAVFFNPRQMDIDLAADGTLYISVGQGVVRRVTPDGRIFTVAGVHEHVGDDGDGGLATQATFFQPVGVALGRDGSLYISDASYERVRRVGPDGIVTAFAGQRVPLNTPGAFAGDGGPALLARFARYGPTNMAVAQDGSLYIADTQNQRIRRVGAPLPWMPAGDIFLPAADGSEVYLFNRDGRHLRTYDALTGAVRWEFGYDSGGRLSTITDGDNNVTTIERDADGNPTAIVSPYGQRTTLAVDANGYLASITNPANETQAFTYTDDGLMTGLTDARGHTWSFTYDDLGRLTQDADPVGGSKTLARTEESPQDYTVSITTAEGRTRSYRIEQLPTGDEQRTNTAADGTQTVQTYGADSSQTATDPSGTTTSITQSPDPRFGMQAPLTSQSIAMPSGLTWSSSMQRLVALADPDDVLSLTGLTSTVTTNGSTFTSVFDAASRTTTTTTPAGRQLTTTADSLGRVTLVALPGLLPIAKSYDALGRLSAVTQGTGASARSTIFTYDAAGYLASVTDAANRTTTFVRDAAGRTIQQTLPNGRVATFSYDANGNVSSITPPDQLTHEFNYTPVDLQSAYSSLNSEQSDATTYDYNLDRQLTRITRPDGLVIDFGYDATGRLSTQMLPTGQISYTYDPVTGRTAAMTAADGGVLSFTYDGSLLMSEAWAGAVSGGVSRSYDDNLRLATQSVNSGDTVAFQYDADGLLTGAGALNISRDPQNGLLAGSVLGTVTDSLTHDGFGGLASYSATVGSAPLYAVQYTRDSLGRVTEKTETLAGTTATVNYTYDQAGRLTDVMRDGSPTAHYDYDANGNRISGFNELTSSIATTYDDQERLLAYSTPAGVTTYDYTANGELQGKADASGTTTYVYDVLGNLRSVTLPDGTLIEYVIDAQNRRVGKKVNGALVQGFLYNGRRELVAELDGSCAVVARFVYGPKPNVPAYLVRYDGQGQPTGTYRVISDHLGSVRLVVEATTGAIAQRIDYDEFGNVLLDTNPGFQPFGFGGGLYDPHTGLVRFGWRDYDPQIGRWTAKDPVLFGGGLNVYAYVNGDPVNQIDPTGLVCISTSNEFYEITRHFEYTVVEGAISVLGFAEGDSCRCYRTSPTTDYYLYVLYFVRTTVTVCTDKCGKTTSSTSFSRSRISDWLVGEAGKDEEESYTVELSAQDSRDCDRACRRGGFY